MKSLYLIFLISIALVANATEIKNFEALAKAEKWEEILAEGSKALESANPQEQARICAQLTSTSFYKGDFALASIYAKRCHELAEYFEDPSLFIRALYLESAVYRAQNQFAQALQTAEEATKLIESIDNIDLKGKVYFNLGAAHADDPNGNLDKAGEYYQIALVSFAESENSDDVIRTSLRLGKVYLLQKNYAEAQEIIDTVRPQLTSERLAMHTDYLEAQLKLALGDISAAKAIAQLGLQRAKTLGAKADERRLQEFLDKI